MTDQAPTPLASGPALSVNGLVKRFSGVTVLDDVSFAVPAGSFMTLLGPSGSGKTTILRLLGGFESADAGTMVVGGVDITALPPWRRDIGVVFQRYSLFPHMTVAENVAFPLKQRRVSRSERTQQVAAILETVGLPDLAGRYPSQLSGGQQQRVALARALVFKPRILLMDEPLSALDKHLREQLQGEIRTVQRQLGITTVYVTHDQTEAFVLSDIVAVLSEGRIEQVAPPRVLYDSPRTEFVAKFVGDSNLFRGNPIVEGTDTFSVAVGDGARIRFKAPAGTGSKVTLLVRPEKITLTDTNGIKPDANALSGRITAVNFLGDAFTYRVAAVDQEILVREQNRPGLVPQQVGNEVQLTWLIADTVALS